MPSAPYDRAIALACTLPALRTRWLHVRCRCGASHALPINLTLLENPSAQRWTLADLVVRVRCKQCRGRDLTIHLQQDSISKGYHGGGMTPENWWALLLHGTDG